VMMNMHCNNAIEMYSFDQRVSVIRRTYAVSIWVYKCTWWI